jgi:hypothetical protein
MTCSTSSISTVSCPHLGAGGAGSGLVIELLKDPRIIQKFSNPAQHFKEYKATDADSFLTSANHKFFYGSVVELGDKGRENLKLVAEELDIDIASLFQMYEYVGAESKNVIAKVIRGSYQEDMGNVMVKPLLPKFSDEQLNIYKILQIFISIRAMPSFGQLKGPITDFVESLALRHNLLANLWSNFKTLWKKTTPKMFKTNPSLFYMSKLKQQIWICLAIFKGISTGLFKVDEALFKDMFQTFKEQRFKGSFIHDEVNLTDGTLAREAALNSDNISHLCCLILIAALRIEDILLLDDSLLLSNENMSYRIITKVSGDIMKEIVDMNNSCQFVIPEIAHFIMAFIQTIESVSYILEKRDDMESKNVQHKLIEVLRGITADLNLRQYEKSIEKLFESPIYIYLTEPEKDMVKRCIKNMIILMVTPKGGNKNMLEGCSDSEIEFISKTLFKIIDSPEELETFWVRFDPSSQFGPDYSMIFSNFLDIFPLKAELTFSIASHILGGGRNNSYVSNVIELFSAMQNYTISDHNLEILKKMSYEKKNIDSGSDAEIYELQAPFEVPNTDGFVIPAGTTFTFTNNHSIKFKFLYNYWNLFWRSLTSAICESKNKNIALSGSQFKFLKLICKMIKLEPLQAPLLQLLMLTEPAQVKEIADERIREQEVTGYAGLAIIFLDILSLCKSDNQNIGIVLEIMKAINGLIVSEIGMEFMLVAQAYSSLNKIEGDDEDCHVLASIMDIFQQKYYGITPKPAYLLAEMVQLVESIILKSEYLFEIFQSPEIVKFIGMSPHSDDDKEVTNILSQCINLYQNKYWSEIDTKILNRTFTETAFRYTPGTKFIPSKLIENLLGIVLTQAMDIVNNSTIIDFENIIEVKLLIKARIFSILNNLISRFKVGTGTALLINRQDNPRSLSHDFLIEYFNSLNLTKFLMSCFDIEINAQGIFFGTREAGSYENVFGLENKSFVNEVKYASSRNSAIDAFQTFIIESIRCFGTVCDLIIDYVRDTRIAASRLGFVIELSLHLLSPEDFYRNIFNNFSNEYSANFFVMFMILSDFNREKGLEKYSRNKIHTYHLAISTLSNPALFNSDNTFDYQGMFASKINQGFILSSGKTEQILRANSVSTASLQAMYSVLRLWRKANRASKPVLADLLTGSQLSPHFSNQVFPWVVFSDLAAQGADPPHERHHLQLVRGAPRHEVHRRVPHLAADLLQRARQVLH